MLPLFSEAAVAVVLREDAHLLLIQRPLESRDRWSGDVAFPGGLRHPEDRDLGQTARRETLEEVGIELAEPEGALRPRYTLHPARRRPLRVTPLIFRVSGESAAAASPDPREVHRMFWISLQELRSIPVRWIVRKVGRLPLLVPAIDLQGSSPASGAHATQGATLWGLTLSMVRELLVRP